MTKKESGLEVLGNKSVNRGTTFTRDEREELGLRGLLPHAVFTEEV